MFVLSVHTLLKVVGYYDMSVLSMSVIGFPIFLSGGWWFWGELYPFLFGFLEFLKLCKAPKRFADAMLLGYLLGAENYYTHERCVPLLQSRFCGLDLHDNEEAVRNETEVYSTHLFTSRAERIVEEHANSGTDKASRHRRLIAMKNTNLEIGNHSKLTDTKRAYSSCL